MNPWVALAVSAALLLAPWLLMPSRGSDEIRGIVRGLWWLNALYCDLWHRLDIRTESTIPDAGPALLISNHTCCIDHMLLQAATRRLLGFMIAKELYEFWLFRPLCAVSGCIPVRRDGRDISATRSALRALGQGRVIPIFPEGKILPTSGRELGESRPGVAFIAVHAGVPVIPAYICGTPESNKVVRSYLTPSRARLYFGPPIDLSGVGDGREALAGVTVRLMDAIGSLREVARGDLPRS